MGSVVRRGAVHLSAASIVEKERPSQPGLPNMFFAIALNGNVELGGKKKVQVKSGAR